MNVEKGQNCICPKPCMGFVHLCYSNLCCTKKERHHPYVVYDKLLKDFFNSENRR